MQPFACYSAVDDTPFPVPPRAVYCLGNFDGVHVGHRALLTRGVEMAKKKNLPCGVFLFDPPSSDFLLTPPPFHLTTQKERSALLASCGISFYIAARFPALRALSADAFIQTVLLRDLGAAGAVCGYNFKFGKDGQGTPDALSDALGAENVLVLPCVSVDGQRVSASAVRRFLQAGDVKTAAALLGRPYSLKAEVCHGKELARTWNLPTANQSFPPQKLIPAAGVYLTVCTVDKVSYPAISNVGNRPTIQNDAHIPNCESHILGNCGNLYGKSMETSFLCRLRAEVQFASEEALHRQICADVEAANAFFAKEGML